MLGKRDMKFLNKIPNWLRWILLLPVSFLALLIVYPIVFIGNRITMWFMGKSFFQEMAILVLANFWSAASFVWVGATIAPRKNFIVSIIMAIIFAFILGGMLFAKLISRTSLTWLETIIACITGIFAVCGVVYSFHQKEIEDSSDSY